jgi:hypothetical protein
MQIVRRIVLSAGGWLLIPIAGYEVSNLFSTLSNTPIFGAGVTLETTAHFHRTRAGITNDSHEQARREIHKKVCSCHVKPIHAHIFPMYDLPFL